MATSISLSTIGASSFEAADSCHATGATYNELF